MRVGVALLLACALASVPAAPVLAGGSVPEHPRFRLLGVRDGVPHTTVTGLARDRARYLWLSTNDGLARHDGVGFRTWRHDPADPASLRRNVIEALLVDARDRIWVATEGGGLAMMDAARDGFRHFTRTSDPRIGSDDVWALASRGDTLWFGTYAGGLHRLDTTPEGAWAIERFVHAPGDVASLPSDHVLALAFDAAGRLWVGTTAGLAWRRCGRRRSGIRTRWCRSPATARGGGSAASGNSGGSETAMQRRCRCRWVLASGGRSARCCFRTTVHCGRRSRASGSVTCGRTCAMPRSSVRRWDWPGRPMRPWSCGR